MYWGIEFHCSKHNELVIVLSMTKHWCFFSKRRRWILCKPLLVLIWNSRSEHFYRSHSAIMWALFTSHTLKIFQWAFQITKWQVTDFLFIISMHIKCSFRTIRFWSQSIFIQKLCPVYVATMKMTLLTLFEIFFH